MGKFQPKLVLIAMPIQKVPRIAVTSLNIAGSAHEASQPVTQLARCICWIALVYDAGVATPAMAHIPPHSAGQACIVWPKSCSDML